MQKKTVLLSVVCALVTSICSFAQTVVLTPQNDHVCVKKAGTVTFSGPGITLEEIAKEEGLPHVSGRTYRAAVIYDALFERGCFCDPRGKIYNCTDKTISVTCAFYSGYRLIAKNRIEVRPRVFMRITGPDDGPSIECCDKIVLSD